MYMQVEMRIALLVSSVMSFVAARWRSMLSYAFSHFGTSCNPPVKPELLLIES